MVELRQTGYVEHKACQLPVHTSLNKGRGALDLLWMFEGIPCSEVTIPSLGETQVNIEWRRRPVITLKKRQRQRESDFNQSSKLAFREEDRVLGTKKLWVIWKER